MGVTEWARRLGIGGHDLEAFTAAFRELDDETRNTPPPQKDGTRCGYCRKKIMLDSRFKELCNGLCTPKGSGDTRGAVKILEIWRALGAADAAAPAVHVVESDGRSAVVGLSRIASTLSEEEEPKAPQCRSLQCRRDATASGFCTRRCEAGEADRIARVARMLLDEEAERREERDKAARRAARPADAAPPPPAARKPKPASLGSLMKSMAKAPAPAAPPPPKAPSAAEARATADLAALEDFVVGVVGEKYWPLFVENEIDDLDTLKDCTAKDLADMKIPLGPRLKLVKELKKLSD